MKRPITFALTFIYLSLLLRSTQAQEAESVSAITQKLMKSPKDPAAATLITTATSLIKTSPQIPLDDELNLMNVVVVREDKDTFMPEILSALEAKYASDPLAGARLYAYEAGIYRSSIKDQVKEFQALDKAETLSVQAQTGQALAQLDLYLQMADSYLGKSEPDKAVENREKALSYYQKVIDFPLVDQPYWDKLDDFGPRYTQAAIGIVSLTEMHKMNTLHFYPFALDAIARQFPRKAGLISPDAPGIAEFTEKLVTWLDLSAKEQPAGSPQRAQFEAVLKYAQTTEK